MEWKLLCEDVHQSIVSCTIRREVCWWRKLSLSVKRSYLCVFLVLETSPKRILRALLCMILLSLNLAAIRSPIWKARDVIPTG